MPTTIPATVTTFINTLTLLERRLFKAALESAAENGYDFGFGDDTVSKAAGDGLSTSQLSGALSTMLKKASDADMLYNEDPEVNGRPLGTVQICPDGDLEMWLQDNDDHEPLFL